MSVQIKARRAETEVPLTLSITRSGPVSGATAVVAVRDGNTNDSYLDFGDQTFKAAGWATRQAALTDIGGGFYTLSGGLNLSTITNLPAATEILFAEYEVTAPAADVGVAGPDVVLIEAFADDVAVDVERLYGENTRTRLYLASAAVVSGVGGAIRNVPLNAASHMEVEVKADAASDWSSPLDSYFVVFNYQSGATATSRPISSTTSGSAPADGTFQQFPYPF